MGFSLLGSVALLGTPLYRGVSAIGGFSPFCGPERGLRNRERIGTLDSGGKVPLLSDLGTIGTHSTQNSIVGHLNRLFIFFESKEGRKTYS